LLDLAMLGGWAVRLLFGLFGYMGGNGSFPHPLSPEEEAEYVRRMRKGDLEARNILIEHNLRLVVHLVKKFESSGEDQEDLISIGTIGLIKGVETYDPSRGTRLATYAARCVENEILMHLRARKKLQKEVFLHDPIGTDREGNEITYLDVLREEDDSVPEKAEQNCLREKIARVLEGLRTKEREVIQLRFGLELTQREVGKRLHISRSYVSRLESKAVSKIGRALIGENLS